MRIVVIGAGRMGVIRAEDLVADGRVDEIVISNRNPERAAELAARLGGMTARVTTTPWGEWPDADAYAVTTATDTHADLLEQLVPRRKPVLIEKPLAMTLEETDALISGAQGITMQVGFQRRFDTGLRLIKEAIESGQLGTLYSLTLTAHDIAPGSPEFIAGSGGTFRDMLVHDFDQARWLGGSDIVTVYATGTVRHHPDYAAAGDYDVVAAHLTLANGVPVLISGTRHDPLGHDIRAEAFGSLDSIAAGLNPRTPLHAADDADGQRLLGAYLSDGARDSGAPNVETYRGFMDRFRDAFTAETSAFVDVVRGERANPCTPQDARAALAAAIACEMSAREGRVVAMAEIE